MNRYKIVLSIIIFLLLASCKKDNPLEINIAEDEIKNSSRVECLLLSTSPRYKQSTILCKYNRDLYLFGTHLPYQVFNLDTKAWTEIALTDASFARWDGTALYVGDNIYMIGNIILGQTNDIVKYSPVSKKYEHTGII